MIWLRLSTAIDIILGPFVDSLDGSTPLTGLTINQADVKISKNGGAFATKNAAGGGTHMAGGHYLVSLDTTDTNTTGYLRVQVNMAGALPVWHDFMVVFGMAAAVPGVDVPGQMTLYDATLGVARLVGQVREALATGGSTSTLVDSAIFQGAGFYSRSGAYGTLWLHGERTFHTITSHAVNTTLSFVPSAAQAVGAGDYYSAAVPDFPLEQLVTAINIALQGMGRMTWEKLVTAVADQESYDSTDDAVFSELVTDIWLSNSDAEPYYWTPHPQWDPKTTMGVRSLVFRQGHIPTEAWPMRVGYLAVHPQVSAADDVIHQDIHPVRLAAEAAMYALRFKVRQDKAQEDYWTALFNEAQTTARRERVAHALPGERSRIIPSRW